jgi:hypothetical protein
MFGRRLVLAAAIALTFGANAQAAPFSFDFDGAGGAAPIGGVLGFDYAPGNLVSVGVNPGGVLTVGAGFTSYFQATLQALQTTGGNVAPPGGREVTVVATINERVASVVGPTATFDILGGSFKIYAGPANANNLLGTGFNDGTLIMSGTIPAVSGVNNFTAIPLFVGFDQVAPDDYAGLQSLFGSGSFLTFATPTSFDPNYFLVGDQSFSTSFLNGTNQSFFNLVNPSKSFAGAGGPASPNLGAINAASGPDIQFQLDANQSFLFTPNNNVPEPATMAVFGLMAATGAFGVRRRVRAKV